MILINFAYPLTQEIRTAIEQLCSQTIDRVIPAIVELDNDRSFKDQVKQLFLETDLPLEEMMSKPVAVILPSHAFIAALVLVELQGRIGRFPAIIRFRPIPDSLPVAYELAEMVDLQHHRDEIRQERSRK